jgi:cellulase/cellobiase CelA1
MDAGRPVDATGRIIDSAATDGEFDGVVELSALLAGSDEVARCFALQWLRFAYGVQENEQLSCALQQLQEGFVRSGGRIRDLLLATTRTAHFRLREPGEPGTAAPDQPQEPGEPTEPPPDAGGGDTMPDNLTVTTRRDSTWAEGHCDTVSVRNDSDQSLLWSIELTIEGRLTDRWNCTASADTGEVTFTGADWNKSVAPGATAEFGYCVSTKP